MAELLKNVYNPKYIEGLAHQVQLHHPVFDGAVFQQKVLDAHWETLELKDRMHRITHCLHECLDLPYAKSLEVLKKIAPEAGGLEGLFLPNYIERYGLEEEWALNMEGLAYLTQYSSSEFAVRPFIKKDETRMMAQMLEWSLDENLHVRRLASEGCRPRLPWGMALKSFQKDPSLVLPILENLNDDESEYVRRSVANNLNDISKDHPDLVLEVAERWLGENEGRKKLVKHALRTLLKKGSTRALLLFGFGDPAEVKVERLSLDPLQPAIGEKAAFAFEVHVNTSAQLRVEYAIDFLKKNGSHSRKVFQFTERVFDKGAHSLAKQHSFQQLTTRIHYPGMQKLLILVNGKEKASLDFELT